MGKNNTKIIMGFLGFAIIGLFVLASGYWSSTTQASVQDEILLRQQQIAEIQRQIDEYQKEIDSASGKARTLSGEIGKLNAQINQYQLEIKSLNLAITQTNQEISGTQMSIGEAEEKLAAQLESLAGYIRIQNESDQENMLEIILKHERISDFFNDLKNLGDAQDKLLLAVEDIRGIKSDLEQKEEDLLNKKTELHNLNAIQQQQKKALDQRKAYQNKLLADTKGQEAKYQEMVKQSQRNIAAIRAQISNLEQSGITAEDAVKYAELAATRAGIRPAFLLALLEWETGMGKNTGQCIMKDPITADGINTRTGGAVKRVMKPMGLSGRKGDVTDFLSITQELGLDPFNTKVSCPSLSAGGYGGGMGPAQFIPTTWMGYRQEVARITGHNPPNPWAIEDSFTASAIKLARGGATAQTRASEIAAAKAYYSGNSKCSTTSCNSYANGIQRIAEQIEKNL